MKKPVIVAVSILAMLAGCGQGADNNVAAAGNEAGGNEVVPEAEVPNMSAAPEPAPAPDVATGNNIVPNAVSGSAQREFSVVNNSGRLVTRLVYSVAGEDDYGIDMLAMQTLPAGYTARVGVGQSEGCVHDLRATLEGGETRDLRGVNVCEQTTVTLEPA